jgi:hypothetical protein
VVQYSGQASAPASPNSLTIASTSLLHYIQEAHKPQTNSLQASNPVSMNTTSSFFLQAEGHSADISTGDQSPIHKYESDDDETDSQSNRDSRSLREDNSQSDSHSDNANNSNSDDDHNSQYDNDSLYSNSDGSSSE